MRRRGSWRRRIRPVGAVVLRLCSEPVTSKPTPAARWRQNLLVLLAVVSGATDAIGFVALGGAFTSVMTGNMVLIGLSVAKSDGTVALRSALAIVLFMTGCVIGSRLAGQPADDDPLWPRQVTRAMWVEFAAFGAYAIGWWLSGSHPIGNVQLVLLGANAIALGVQSSAVLRFGVSGLSTTYMTGTLTTMMAALAAGRHPRLVVPSAEIIAGLIAGAAAATLLAIYVPVVAPLLQLGLVLVVIVTAMVRFSAPEPALSH
jgi:uncharacterized membrane protein YoaK (UPF0700 family)